MTKNFALMLCVFTVLVLCSAVDMVNAAEPSGPVAKARDWTSVVGAITGVYAALVTTATLIYIFAVVFTKVNILWGAYKLVEETLIKSALEQASRSITPSNPEVSTPSSPSSSLPSLSDLALNIEEIFSRKEGKKIKKILGKNWSVEQKVAAIIGKVGIERLSALVDEEDRTKAIGKLTILVRDYSISMATEATGGSF